MIVKIHKREGRTIVAVCDSTLLGKKFEENNFQLDLGSDFYAGTEMDETEAGDLIRNADIVNLVGDESVELGIKEGVIDREHVKSINKIPHAQAAILHES